MKETRSNDREKSFSSSNNLAYVPCELYYVKASKSVYCLDHACAHLDYFYEAPCYHPPAQVHDNYVRQKLGQMERNYLVFLHPTVS